MNQFRGQCSFSIWSTAALQHSPKHGHCRDRQHHTHTDGGPRGEHSLSGERKRATDMKWSYILCICSNFMTKSPSNGSAAHVSRYQQVQDEFTVHVVVICCNLISHKHSM